MNVILEVSQLGKSFGGVHAVQDVSFSVKRGTICSLIGPNGAGKTTVFNMISGLVPPTRGSVRFDGEIISGLPTHRMAHRGLGRTFQNLAVFAHASVVDNILVGMHSQLSANPLTAALYWGGVRKQEIEARQRVEEIIDFLEIQSVRDLPVGTLSYGLQKRVELGRALAMNPRLLLLDEMVSGMNQEETEDIARFILDIKEQLDVTVLMVEHDMGIVMDISDQVVVLEFGKKIGEGTPSEVSHDARVMAAYLGNARSDAA
ncbi:MAG: ABC transporter ATP-binding protein [Afipia sp.]|nr:ABC transporter ATP-binding protein [Afipia sp.]